MCSQLGVKSESLPFALSFSFHLVSEVEVLESALHHTFVWMKYVEDVIIGSATGLSIILTGLV